MKLSLSKTSVPVFLLVVLVWPTACLRAQPHEPHSHGEDDAQIERPKVYLDKSPRIVEYQLKRLDNARLLLVETAHDDPKYVPVFRAILLRSGIARKNRDEALHGLVMINKTDAATELLSALQALDANEQRVGRQLSAILLEQPKEVLSSRLAELKAAAEGENAMLQAVGFAGMIVSGEMEEASRLAQKDDDARLAWLSGVSLIPRGPLKDTLRNGVFRLLADDQTPGVRTRAIQVIADIGSNQADTFEAIADFVTDKQFRTVAVRSLLRIPEAARSRTVSARLVSALVEHAESTPAEERTSEDFLDAMQLVDELLSKLPTENARSFRDRLREVTVRVVRLHTVEEEMRFDRTYFAVEAGRPVQVVLENDDLMPHNIVITKAGKLKEVALAGAALGTMPGLDGKLYVPETSDVLFATSMVNAGQRELLTFNAPTEPGEYPYVCTFPRHWMRMYGVMIVVPDLDAWQRNPTEPKDPLGNSRTFVKSWKLDDFPREELEQSLRGRNPLIGAKLFKDATCLGCHKIATDGEGGAVGPALADVMKRWKGDRHGILREILDPSYKIDPKYAVKIVLDVDGKTTSGIVTAEDSKSISILSNPEVPEPRVISKDDIEEIIPSATSMMPKALLDKFSRDEIMEILSYITADKEE